MSDRRLAALSPRRRFLTAISQEGRQRQGHSRGQAHSTGMSKRAGLSVVDVGGSVMSRQRKPAARVLSRASRRLVPHYRESQRGGTASPGASEPWACEIQHVCLDVTGTLLSSGEPKAALPGAAIAVSQLRHAGLALSFATNESAYSSKQLAGLLSENEIDAHEVFLMLLRLLLRSLLLLLVLTSLLTQHEVFTPVDVAVAHVKRGGRRPFVLARAAVSEAFHEWARPSEGANNTVAVAAPVVAALMTGDSSFSARLPALMP